MPLIRDIPQLTQHSGYSVHCGWDHLPSNLAHHVLEYGLNLNPDFQREHVWNLDQKIKYVEYVLRGGQSGRDLWFNSPGWQLTTSIDWYVLVDGKQRLDAVMGFLNNEFPVFGGNYRRDYTDRFRLQANFVWHVNTLKTRDECLQWYLDLNRGGTPHTEEEILRVQDLLGKSWEPVSSEEIRSYGGLSRQVIVEAIEADRLSKLKIKENTLARDAAKVLAEDRARAAKAAEREKAKKARADLKAVSK